MRRQDQLNPIGHQSLTHSEIPCVRECVCNNRVFDVFSEVVETFSRYAEQQISARAEPA